MHHHQQPPPPHHQHVHQVNVHPSMHPQQQQHSSMNMNMGPQQQQQIPHHIMPNININVPPPQTQQQQQQNPQHSIQPRPDHNRINQHRLNQQMHQPPPPTHHGLSSRGANLHNGSKPITHHHNSKNPLHNQSISNAPLQQSHQIQSQQQQHQMHQTSSLAPTTHHSSNPQPKSQRTISILENPNKIHNSGGGQLQHHKAKQQTTINNNNSTISATPIVVKSILQPPEKTTSTQTSTSSITTTTTTTPSSSTTSTIIEVSAATANEQTTSLIETLANSKEKTPMCLVNELARYNKIQHQYRLTGEQGPAHKKRFTVTLKLGEEEYTSDGASIKKAQHSAAGEAIGKTKYKHPPAKTTRITRGGSGRNSGPNGINGDDLGNITPTVELNALAMKRGEPAVYLVDPPSSVVANQLTQVGGAAAPANQQIGNNFAPINQQYGGGNNNYSNRNSQYNNHAAQRYNYDRRPMTRGFGKNPRYPSYNQPPPGTPEDPYKVTLNVGQRKFIGIGNTLQSARHDAASKALEVLKPITPEDDANDLSCDDDINSDLKSPISLVHEVALKRSLTVSFQVQSEKGPPHMKTFVTFCICGSITTEGEGNGKKLSKKRAAESMLVELRKLPPTSPVPNRNVKPMKRNKPQPIKKKTRNLIKEHAEEDNDDVNPISRLIHISQGNKAKDPIYTLIEERGAQRSREFVIEVSAVGERAQGAGPTKKLAKRQAADNLLSSIGFALSSVVGNKDSVAPTTAGGAKSVEATGAEKPRKVTFQENAETVLIPSTTNQGGSAGRQLVPGLLLMQQANKEFTSNKSGINTQTTATIAKELLNAGTSPTADALVKSGGGSAGTVPQTPATGTSVTNLNNSNNMIGSGQAIRPKDQLMYLAQLLDFQVQFSDFPKGNHGEFLTLITLSTEPPQLCHGAGCSAEASHDQAAVTALKMLSELGLDNVKPIKPSTPSDDKKIKPILSNGIKK